MTGRVCSFLGSASEWRQLAHKWKQPSPSPHQHEASTQWSSNYSGHTLSKKKSDHVTSKCIYYISLNIEIFKNAHRSSNNFFSCPNTSPVHSTWVPTTWTTKRTSEAHLQWNSLWSEICTWLCLLRLLINKPLDRVCELKGSLQSI